MSLKLFNERSSFLVIPAEEITARYKLQPIHINATNLRSMNSSRRRDQAMLLMSSSATWT